MPMIPVLGTGDEGAIGWRKVPEAPIIVKVRKKRGRPTCGCLLLLTVVGLFVYAAITEGGTALDLWLR